MRLRHLMATTAIVALMGGVSVAQDANQSTQGAQQNPTTQDMQTPDAMKDRWLSSELTGKPVYAAQSQDDKAIGEINDLVISATGEIESVIVGVGGFLGIGEKDVAIDFSELSLQPEENGELRLSVATSKDALTSAPAFDRDAVIAGKQSDEAMAPGQTAEQTAPATQPATETAQTAPAAQPATETAQTAPAAQPATETAQTAPAAQPGTETAQTAPAAQPGTEMAQTDPAAQPSEAKQVQATATADAESTASIGPDSISAEKLIGLSVYDGTEERVGEVGDVILAQDGMVDAVVVDVGGFLGIGEKPVAIGFDQLQINQVDANDIRLMSAISKDKLEAATAYDKGEYVTRRDEMRVQVTQ